LDASSRILTNYSIQILGTDAILLVIYSSHVKEKTAYRTEKNLLTVWL